jgi:hypothetical protein
MKVNVKTGTASVMKKRLPASFDDLIKHHYGSARHVMLSNTVKAERRLLITTASRSVVRKSEAVCPRRLSL